MVSCCMPVNLEKVSICTTAVLSRFVRATCACWRLSLYFLALPPSKKAPFRCSIKYLLSVFNPNHSKYNNNVFQLSANYEALEFNRPDFSFHCEQCDWVQNWNCAYWMTMFGLLVFHPSWLDFSLQLRLGSKLKCVYRMTMFGLIGFHPVCGCDIKLLGSCTVQWTSSQKCKSAISWLPN